MLVKISRTCPTLKQVILNSTYNSVIQRSLTVKREIGKYDVQHNTDQYPCVINRLCVLRNGKILLCDNGNRSLKKLDTSYKLVSCISIPGVPYDMCYIGKGKAVVLLMVSYTLSKSSSIRCVNVSGDLSIEGVVKCDHIVDCLACHGDTLYTCGQDTVRRCKTDCTQESDLCKIQSTGDTTARHMAVSDDGENIYVADGVCLIVINNKGNYLYSFKTHNLILPSHVCCVEDGSVFVCDANSDTILQVDHVNSKVVGTVVQHNHLLLMSSKVRPTTLCYDRKCSRLVVGFRGRPFISVFDLYRDGLEQAE